MFWVDILHCYRKFRGTKFLDLIHVVGSTQFVYTTLTNHATALSTIRFTVPKSPVYHYDVETIVRTFCQLPKHTTLKGPSTIAIAFPWHVNNNPR